MIPEKKKRNFPQHTVQTDVCVAPLRRSAVRLRDLNSEELTDLMSVVERVQNAVETEYDAQDSTISMQVVSSCGTDVTDPIELSQRVFVDPLDRAIAFIRIFYSRSSLISHLDQSAA